MNNNEQEDKTIYAVVINHEEQYSIWAVDRQIPLGWQEVGKRGLKEECLAYIEEVWTDMRPLSLRKKMEEMARQVKENPTQPETLSPEQPVLDSLVQRLANGDHPIIASRVDNLPERLMKSIERGFVLIKFTDTRGGTELGVRLDKERIDLSHVDLEQLRGTVHLEGDLKLNYVTVRCITDIDLETLEGKGHLEVLQ